MPNEDSSMGKSVNFSKAEDVRSGLGAPNFPSFLLGPVDPVLSSKEMADQTRRQPQKEDDHT
jgi:hypothetical protein